MLLSDWSKISIVDLNQSNTKSNRAIEQANQRLGFSLIQNALDWQADISRPPSIMLCITSTLSSNTVYHALHGYHYGGRSIQELAASYNKSERTVRNWICIFEKSRSVRFSYVCGWSRGLRRGVYGDIRWEAPRLLGGEEECSLTQMLQWRNPLSCSLIGSFDSVIDLRNASKMKILMKMTIYQLSNVPW